MASWKNLGKLTVVAFAAAFLAVLSLLVLGYATGRITAEKIEMVVKALRGERVPMRPGAACPKDLTGRYEMRVLEERRRALEEMRRQEELLLLRLNERRAQMTKLEGEAARIHKELSDRAGAVAREEATFSEAKAAYERQLKSRGLKKAVETVENMRRREIVARILYDYETPLAVEILKAMRSDLRGKVMEEIDKLDRLGENASHAAKAPLFLKLIYEGDPRLVTFKPE